MLFDVVQERQAQVETGVSSRLKRVEGGVEEVKQGLNSLNDDANQRLGKLQQYALSSVLETAGMRYASALKEWTGKSTASVVYDSKIDPFTDDGLFQAIKDRENIAIIATTSEGDVFGGFYSRAVLEQSGGYFLDPNMFIFSFESHGRCETPQRFLPKGYAHVMFYKDTSAFVSFDAGTGWFHLGNEKSRTYCAHLSQGFEGIKNSTLTGKRNGENFTCCRLVAIQLE